MRYRVVVYPFLINGGIPMNVRADRRNSKMISDMELLKMSIQEIFHGNDNIQTVDMIKCIDRRIFKNERYLMLPQKYQHLINGYIDAWWDVRRLRRNR
jgi:hypothetical protein